MFGYQRSANDNLHYAEDGSLFFAAGHCVVVQSADGKSQRFIPGSDAADGITALAMSPSRKLLAVAEKADKGLISVYDTASLKKRKVLQAGDVGSQVCGRGGGGAATAHAPTGVLRALTGSDRPMHTGLPSPLPAWPPFPCCTGVCIDQLQRRWPPAGSPGRRS